MKAKNQENSVQKNLLERGIEEIIDKKNLEKKLASGKKLRIKLGIDPTSSNIHLGRSIPLLKLRDFQQVGHKVVFIIGDFTGVIGDTSDKESERPMLSPEVIAENLKNYISQAAKIIDTDKAEIYHNSEWLGELKYQDVGRQADIFSLNEFISRENIKKRLDAGKRVSLRELLYPLMQGYDSVKVKADVEIGGTDQKFNLLAGRDLQRLYGQEPQDIITNPLIEGLDGRKMSSSFGNTVNLFDSANDMFGKIMSLKDEFIIKYFTLLTRVDLMIVANHEKQLAAGANPRDIKLALAKEIVKMYHSVAAAQEAEAYFVKTIFHKEIPEEMPKFEAAGRDVVSVLISAGLVKSKSEARRLLEQGGIKIDGQIVKDYDFIIPPGSVLQKGKLNFLKVL